MLRFTFLRGWFLWTPLVILIVSTPLWATSPQALKMLSGEKTSSETVSTADTVLAERLKNEDVDRIIASLSDEQVRRLLMAELARQAREQEAAAVAPEGGLAGFIQQANDVIDRLKGRIALLKSGDSLAPEQIPSVFTYLGKGEKDANTTRAIWQTALIFAIGLLAQFLFFAYTASTRQKIATASYQNWLGRLGGVSFRALLDFLAMVVFAAAVLALFYLFFDRTTPQRVLVATYLIAFLIVQAVVLVSRFLLVPKYGDLRLLPFDDETAGFLFRWITAISIVGSFGLLTCGVYRLAGASEAAHFQMVMLVSLVMCFMLVAMILLKRKVVGEALRDGLPAESLRARLAAKWHHFAIFGVFLLLASATIYGLIGTGRYPGIKTLLIIAAYFLADWLLRQILEAAFGLARRPDDLKSGIIHPDELKEPKETMSAASADISPTGAPTGDTDDSSTAETIPSQADLPINISRMRKVIRTGLRIALAALMFFWMLNVWNINLNIGQAVARAAFNILIVVLICYVAWEVVSAAIQRRMKEVASDDDMEEMEEGGAGGSRIGTLLVLLRKFFLVVIIVMATLIILSAVGVDIGPLIAGAGVVGLAIGFGAQTLVKDIIAGVFFLVDDAFRVGDYIQTGGSKGMVEHISLRSLRLRHPRGMVNTIPFGDMGTVTNFSRDYIITKLDFRVRYDTDVGKVRKIIKKKVYEPILANPELAPKLLDKIKSQGVRQLDDSAMIMRIKYKTPPGEQFVLRKEIYRLMQEAFREAGIEFAHRNVTVYLPPEVQQSLSNPDVSVDPKVVDAVGAAAGAAVQQAEEEETRKA